MVALHRLLDLIARAARQPLLLLILATAAAALWGFVEIADEVEDGESSDFDRTVILMLRTASDATDPLGPVWVEEAARDVTALGGIIVLALMVLAAAGYLLLERKHRTALLLVVAGGGGILLSSALKYGFSRPRPDLVPHITQVYTASFPSGHAMLSATVYLTLGALLASAQTDNRTKAYLIGLALLVTVLVGVSRIYLGVHWPTDVLAGWAAGAAWALSLWSLSLWLESRRCATP